MNTVVPSCAPASFPIPEFGRSADGLTVARIGDAAYAMIPIAGGRYFLGSGWSLSNPCRTGSSPTSMAMVAMSPMRLFSTLSFRNRPNIRGRRPPLAERNSVRMPARLGDHRRARSATARAWSSTRPPVMVGSTCRQTAMPKSIPCCERLVAGTRKMPHGPLSQPLGRNSLPGSRGAKPKRPYATAARMPGRRSRAGRCVLVNPARVMAKPLPAITRKTGS